MLPERMLSVIVQARWKELDSYKFAIEKLTKQLDDYSPPFCEKRFISDEYTKFHTELPNFKLVKAIFDHVSKGLSTDGVTKLSNFQRVYVSDVEVKNQCTK